MEATVPARAQSAQPQKSAQDAFGVFFRQHIGSSPRRYSWLCICLRHKPVLKRLLMGKPAAGCSEHDVKCAIMWWNRQITAHLGNSLSELQIRNMNKIDPRFELHADNLRLAQPGARRQGAPKSRRDYYKFAVRLTSCLEHPDAAENKEWLEVLKYRYRHHMLDGLQESMAEAAYPDFCTEKAIMEEKCRLFEENLLKRLANMGSPTNQNWLRNAASLARKGGIHPDYIKILYKYGLVATRRSFEFFIKEYSSFKKAHGEPRQRQNGPEKELWLAQRADSLRKQIRKNPDFPKWKMKRLFDADFSTELERERKTENGSPPSHI